MNNSPKYVSPKYVSSKVSNTDLKFTNTQLEYLKKVFKISYSKDLSNDVLRVQLGEQRVINHIQTIINT